MKTYQRWTYEKVKKEALKYKSRTDFQKGSRGAYKFALRETVLNEICVHMVPKYNYWPYRELLMEAKKYRTRAEFQKKSTAYQVGLRRKLLNRICSHMKSSKRLPYTLKELKKEALKYKRKIDFQKGNVGAYEAALKRSDYEKICGHMPKRIRSGENNPSFKWTIEMLKLEASKYQHRTEFARNSQDAYTAAQKRGLLDIVCVNMKYSGTTSKPEINLFDSIKLNYPKAQKLRDRKVKIENKPHIKGFDLDIYIPEVRKGIEFDGTYWHSFETMRLHKNEIDWSDEDIRNYHQLKDDWFASKGIQIFHVKEEDWIKNKELCIKRCFDFLGELDVKKIA
jgi:hypothetical protein